MAEALVGALREFIETGGFEAGDRLPSFSELARMFAVGVPSVRLALSQLQAMGLVDVRHGSGVYVTDVPAGIFLVNPLADHDKPRKSDLMDIADARLLVEPEAAALAAATATKAQLAAIEAELDAAEEQLSVPYADRLHAFHFHQEIGEASGNRVIHSMCVLLSRLYRKEYGLVLETIRSPEEDNRQHRRIFEAIRDRDAQLARRRMKAHLAEIREAYLHNADLGRRMVKLGIE